jgi:hypothetical protein
VFTLVIDVNEISIDLSLEKGKAYVLGTDGGTGKTYLYKLFNAYENFGDNVLPLTYEKRRDDSDIVKRINNFNGDVVLFDRFDLYFNKDFVNLCLDNGFMVLLDLKCDKYINSLKVQPVNFVRTKNRIEVKKW